MSIVDDEQETAIDDTDDDLADTRGPAADGDTETTGHAGNEGDEH